MEYIMPAETSSDETKTEPDESSMQYINVDVCKSESKCVYNLEADKCKSDQNQHHEVSAKETVKENTKIEPAELSTNPKLEKEPKLSSAATHNPTDNCDSEVKIREPDGASAAELKCPLCAEDFAWPYMLKRHIERKHKNQCSNYAELNITGSCICHHCGFRCRRICDLRTHLSRQHSVIFSYETVSFQNKAEFEAWKATIEDLQCCSYVKTTGVKVLEKDGGHAVQYFNCNRCGMYRPSGKGIRLTKSQGLDADVSDVKAPTNPTDDWLCHACQKSRDDINMIECDSCLKWFGWDCAQLTEEPEEDDPWYCNNCLSNHVYKESGTD